MKRFTSFLFFSWKECLIVNTFNVTLWVCLVGWRGRKINSRVKYFLSGSIKKFSFQIGKKTERRKWNYLIDKNAHMHLHMANSFNSSFFWLSWGRCFPFFFFLFLSWVRRCLHFFFFWDFLGVAFFFFFLFVTFLF